MPSPKKPCVLQGYPWFPGGNRFKDGYNFAVEVPKDAQASLLLYHKKAKTPSMEIPFQEKDRIGDVCAVFLKDFSPEEYEYNYRINGEVVQDTYAYRIYGRDHFGLEAGRKNTGYAVVCLPRRNMTGKRMNIRCFPMRR